MTPLQIAGASTESAISNQAAVAIPAQFSGGQPKYVLLTANGRCHFKPGPSTVSFTKGPGTASAAFVSQDYPVILNVAGMTHIAFESESGTVTVIITPLENQGSGG